MTIMCAGGFRGTIAACWLQDDHFRVDVALRGRSYGTLVLGVTEKAACVLGVIDAKLTTSIFQAPRFYQTQEHAEIRRLKVRPPGYDRIWMVKRWV